MNKRKINLLLFLILIILARFIFLGLEEGDYNFLSNWLIYIRSNGGFMALKHTFSDYNLPYLTFLCIISYIPIKSVYLIKIFSIIFELLIAFISFKLINKYNNSNDTNSKVNKSILTAMIILLLPTVLLNSSVFSQCDSIYTFFIILSLYYLMDNKYVLSFISLGIAFSLKLQFIFILPLYIILFFNKKEIKIWHFLLIPIVNFIMCLPATIVGASPFYTYKIYFLQTNEYGLSNSFVNIYHFLPKVNIIKYVGIIVTLIIFLLLLVYSILKKIKWSNEKILTMALLSIIICVFCLPCMHERYMYMADIISVIWYMLCNKKKNIIIPLVINGSSLYMYLQTLFVFDKYAIVYIIGVITLFYCILYLFNILRKNNDYLGD